jgi:hypothetical protein
MTSRIPPATIRRSAHDVPLRTHLSDAAFHLNNARRSIQAAAGKTTTRWGERKLIHLAAMVERWATRLEPENHERHERDSEKGRSA